MHEAFLRASSESKTVYELKKHWKKTFVTRKERPPEGHNFGGGFPHV